VEGRPDAEEQSVSLITIYAAKGLEWPVVIPINMTGTPFARSGPMHDRRANSFSVPVLGAEPRGYAALKAWEEEEYARERVRLWYVALTRARDLLVLPRHGAKLRKEAWARIVDLNLAALDSLDPAKLGEATRAAAPPPDSSQTKAIFAAEAARIADGTNRMVWQRPSRGEAEAEPPSEPPPVFEGPEEADEVAEIAPAVAGSATRGITLHKLMEEVLTGETTAAAEDLERRASDLLAQLGLKPSADAKLGISTAELAETVLRTLALPEVARLRPRLVPEHRIFACEAADESEILTSGIADAVATDDMGGIDAVVDWKSDVDPSPAMIAHYRNQIGDYRRQTGAKRALLVLMTKGLVVELR
jgi:exodeoxyribonuclease-5